MLIGPFKYVAPQYKRIYNSPFYILLIVKLLYLSSKKKDQEPFIDAQVFKLATDHESVGSVYGS